MIVVEGEYYNDWNGRSDYPRKVYARRSYSVPPEDYTREDLIKLIDKWVKKQRKAGINWRRRPKRDDAWTLNEGCYTFRGWFIEIVYYDNAGVTKDQTKFRFAE